MSSISSNDKARSKSPSRKDKMEQNKRHGIIGDAIQLDTRDTVDIASSSTDQPGVMRTVPITPKYTPPKGEVMKLSDFNVSSSQTFKTVSEKAEDSFDFDSGDGEDPDYDDLTQISNEFDAGANHVLQNSGLPKNTPVCLKFSREGSNYTLVKKNLNHPPKLFVTSLVNTGPSQSNQQSLTPKTFLNLDENAEVHVLKLDSLPGLKKSDETGKALSSKKIIPFTLEAGQTISDEFLPKIHYSPNKENGVTSSKNATEFVTEQLKKGPLTMPPQNYTGILTTTESGFDTREHTINIPVADESKVLSKLKPGEFTCYLSKNGDPSFCYKTKGIFLTTKSSVGKDFQEFKVFQEANKMSLTYKPMFISNNELQTND